MNASQILSHLASSGFRISKVRKNVIEYLSKCQKPHSVPELLNTLKQTIPTLNKTSLYRELTFLKDQGIIQEIELGEGKKRYEISNTHHHHIVCLKCDSIEDVSGDQDLAQQENQIEKKLKFKIRSHSLEYFGICQACQ
jgi:Fe2+ or Zn2+ uptake regulation protein